MVAESLSALVATLLFEVVDKLFLVVEILLFVASTETLVAETVFLVAETSLVTLSVVVEMSFLLAARVFSLVAEVLLSVVEPLVLMAESLFLVLEVGYSKPDITEVYFSHLPAEEAKKKELTMAKNKKGHYRCMVDDEKLYYQIMDALKPFFTKDLLQMLWHQSDTNLNEAMNRSVSAFTPKDRTFCRTMSLETRVGIAAAVQIVGHYQFWNMVLDKFGITMGKSLEKILKKRDVENYFRREYRSIPEVKRKRKHGETTKISKGVRDREKQIS